MKSVFDFKGPIKLPIAQVLANQGLAVGFVRRYLLLGRVSSGSTLRLPSIILLIS